MKNNVYPFYYILGVLERCFNAKLILRVKPYIKMNFIMNEYFDF